MSKKDKNRRQGIVYSTEDNYEYNYENEREEETLSVEDQNLIISLDKKNRKGKQVTLIEGFIGSGNDLNTLAKMLKSFCGTGGNAKNGEILIQGDMRQKISEKLSGIGYKCKLR